MLTAIPVILYWVTTGSASPTAGAVTKKLSAVARWSTVRFGCPQVQIQIGGQHVVEQAGHGTSHEFNVELSVGGKQRGRLIEVAVIPQHVMGITRAQGSEMGTWEMTTDDDGIWC